MAGMLITTISLLGVLLLRGVSAQSPTEAGTTASLPERVTCRVLYQADSNINNASVTVSTTGIKVLPIEPQAPASLVGGELWLPDATTKVTKRIPTKDGAIFETYEGTFTKIIADETFIPLGDRIVMKPEVWFPAANKDEPEIYTAELPAKHLRALWVGVPHFGSHDPISSHYFAVSIQLFSRRFHLKSAVFSGKKTSEVDDGTFLGSIFHRKQVVDLKDSHVVDLDLPIEWAQADIYPRCAAFRMQ